MFRPITKEETTENWAIFAPRFERALLRSAGELILEDIQQGLQQQTMYLWVLENVKGDLHSLCVTQFVDYHRIRTCIILIAEGELDPRWGPAIEYLSKWARKQGCVKLEAFGRFGWLKAARAFGFYPVNVKIAKEI